VVELPAELPPSPTEHGAVERPARGSVSHSGDLGFVRHDAVQVELGAADDGTGEGDGLLWGADRGAVGADADCAAEWLPTGVDVEADADGGGRVGGGGGDEVEVVHGVDHEGDFGCRFGGGGETGDGVGIDGGIGHEDVGGDVGAFGVGEIGRAS